jgi:LacI family transcriptional regulator
LKNKINIQTIAKALQVSVSTVSKALNDSHEISQETKDKILAYAREYDYSPNPYASSLRSKKSKTIGVVIPEVGNSFFAAVVKGIESVARKKGYHVLIYLSNESFDKELIILNEFQTGRVDGILMSLALETNTFEHIEKLLEKNIPTVFFDRIPHAIEATKVVTNDFELGYHATQHLIKQGCQQIAYLLYRHHQEMSNQRMEGFIKALENAEVQFSTNHLIFCQNSKDEIAIKNAITNYTFDGIVISTEELVTPFYLICKQLKINIPEQLKVLSFCDFPLATVLTPTLTTIKHPAFQMGEMAATTLFKKIEKPRQNMQHELIVLESEIIERESTEKSF